MNTTFSVLQLGLALVALLMYLRVRRYLGLHEEEPVEEHAEWLMGRMRVICVLALLAALIGLVRIVL
jgi:NADH:ubiquinone oxidoreductase subunit 2 (subunit N)